MNCCAEIVCTSLAPNTLDHVQTLALVWHFQIRCIARSCYHTPHPCIVLFDHKCFCILLMWESWRSVTKDHHMTWAVYTTLRSMLTSSSPLRFPDHTKHDHSQYKTSCELLHMFPEHTLPACLVCWHSRTLVGMFDKMATQLSVHIHLHCTQNMLWLLSKM